MPPILYVLRSSGRLVKGATRTMPAKPGKLFPEGLGEGCVSVLGSIGESGSAK